MNNLFDSLNCRTPFCDNSIASAVTKTSIHMSEWKEYIDWIESWKFINQTKKPPCQTGFIMTIKAVMGIWEELNKTEVPYLSTNRLNQDCLENTFASIRKRGGFRDNPCAQEFRSSVRNVVVCNFKEKSCSKNCEDDDDLMLINLNNAQIKSVILEDASNDSDELVTDLDVEETPTFNDMEENAIAYISGVLSNALFKKFSCEECKKLLLGEKLLDTHTLFIYFKEYKDTPYGLKWPTKQYYEYITFIM